MRVLGKNVDTLPKNVLWVSLAGTGIIGIPMSVVMAILGIWIPGIGDELLLTAALTGFASSGSAITAACWIVDDKELNQYRRLGPEGRKEYHAMERAGVQQAALARAEQASRQLDLQLERSRQGMDPYSNSWDEEDRRDGRF